LLQIIWVDSVFPFAEVVGYFMNLIADLMFPFRRIMNFIGVKIPIPQTDIASTDGQMEPF